MSKLVTAYCLLWYSFPPCTNSLLQLIYYFIWKCYFCWRHRWRVTLFQSLRAKRPQDLNAGEEDAGKMCNCPNWNDPDSRGKIVSLYKNIYLCSKSTVPLAVGKLFVRRMRRILHKLSHLRIFFANCTSWWYMMNTWPVGFRRRFASIAVDLGCLVEMLPNRVHFYTGKCLVGEDEWGWKKKEKKVKWEYEEEESDDTVGEGTNEHWRGKRCLMTQSGWVGEPWIKILA